MMTKPNKWDVWLALVKFEDKPDVKKRPVVVVDQNIAYYISLKITTHEPRPTYAQEYKIERWKEAQLNHPSTIRASKILELEEKDFVHKIGRLHPVDIMAVQKILEQKSHN